MTVADLTQPGSRSAGRLAAAARRLLLPTHAATIFLSALLLFSLQPMFTKMVTPALGGTPAVWSVAIVFFQAVLLAGYAWAHLLGRLLGTGGAAGAHLAIMGLAFAVTLPVAFDAAADRPPADMPALWLIGVFSVSIGLPFFAVSANAPLLQAWFSRSGHAHARDPYFLYGASNVGSFLALLAYPLLIEPSLTLGAQSAAWSGGFVLLAAGIIACAALILVLRSQVPPPGLDEALSAAAAGGASHTGAGDRLAWIGLALVPSALLVAVTAHLSTDVAAVPLLWVVPLALYLLTFVLAFRGGAGGLHRGSKRLQPFLLALLVLFMMVGAIAPLWLNVASHLAFFFVAAMVCHGELYRRRPSAEALTEFYFFMSLGGVLGGMFSSLLAPALFNSVVEYPLLVLAAIACRPEVRAEARKLGVVRAALAVGAFALLLLAIDAARIGLDSRSFKIAFVFALAAAIAILVLRDRPRGLFAATAGAMLLLALTSAGTGLVERTRSFFGVHVIKRTPDGGAHYLMHGNTIHGAERVRDAAGRPLAGRPEPASYFYRGGPFWQAIEAARNAHGGRLGRVAVIGLGMGSLACHARDGEAWSFFEIDPEVIRIAREPRLFRSLSECLPGAPVVIGDGRLTMAASAGRFDLIVLDVFSSDSVPVHLLTAEAVALYKSKLAETGVLVINISNRHMRLEGVVADVAAANGMVMRHKADTADTGRFTETLKTAAQVAIVARDPSHMGDLEGDGSWRPVPADAARRTWTDDYSNILAPILRRYGR
jgi:hypothetical protein